MKGADETIRNYGEMTAIQAAEKRNNADVVKMLHFTGTHSAIFLGEIVPPDI